MDRQQGEPTFGCWPNCAGCKPPDVAAVHHGDYRCKHGIEFGVKRCSHRITHYFGTRGEQADLWCVEHDPRKRGRK